MIVDCFLFTSEFSMLDIRLHELNDVVDNFILVESNTTFSGVPKPLHFQEQAEQWANWPKLESVIVLDPPKTNNPWDREAYQRNSILRGLRTYPEDTVVLISDADEIPMAASIPPVVSPGEVYVFEQELYYYTMSQRVKGRWRGTRACRLSDLRAWTPQVVRFAGGKPINPGGWHFSYMGGPEAIQRKLASFSHQEYNIPEYTSAAAITKRVSGNHDLFDREIIQLHTVSGLSHLPKYVQENPSLFVDMIWSTP